MGAEQIVDHNLITNQKLQKLNINDNNFKDEACKGSLYNAIMIQYLKNVNTLSQALLNNHFSYYELVFVLFQIYIPLSIMSKEFTHYDLHEKNVLVYEPVKNKYIEYHYYFDDQIISFKSKYIIKIIDYGRSYFKMNNTTLGNSENIYKYAKKKCKTLNKYGFYQNEDLNILPNIKNESYDIRLLFILFEDVLSKKITVPQYLEDFFNTINTNYEVEKIENGFPNNINNVNDAAEAFKEFVQNPEILNDLNEYYESKSYSKYGDLNIYVNGNPMKFKIYEETPPFVSVSSVTSVKSLLK